MKYDLPSGNTITTRPLTWDEVRELAGQGAASAAQEVGLDGSEMQLATRAQQIEAELRERVCLVEYGGQLAADVGVARLLASMPPKDRQLLAGIISRENDVTPEEIESVFASARPAEPDRKSTRLNSSHSQQSRMPSSA